MNCGDEHLREGYRHKAYLNNDHWLKGISALEIKNCYRLSKRLSKSLKPDSVNDADHEMCGD